jgi:branched-chain amino acid transport system substrate-binding protein
MAVNPIQRAHQRRGGRRPGRFFPAVVLGAMLAGPLVCATLPSGSGSHVSSPRNATIRIGVSNVQSGPSSSLGRNLMIGTNAYFRIVNAHGGVHGRPLEVILKDDRYEPDPAVRNTYELITQDKVFFLFNYVGTPTLTRVLPLLKYFEAQSIVNVTPFTGADPQRKPPYDRYVFNIRASYAAETRRLVDYLCAKGYRKIGFLGQADAYGKSGEIGVTRSLQRHGLAIVGSATYRRNDPFEKSMQAQVEILRGKGADAVIAVGVYGPCAAFIRDARLAGWDVPVANVSFVNAQAMLDLLRADARRDGRDLTTHLINSQVVPLPSDTRYPLVRDYRAHVPADALGCTSLEGWLNAVVVTEALRRAGPSPTRVGFIRAMESLGGWDPGLGVKLAFSHTNHQGWSKVWLARSEGGRWVSEESPGAP